MAILGNTVAGSNSDTIAERHGVVYKITTTTIFTISRIYFYMRGCDADKDVTMRASINDSGGNSLGDIGGILIPSAVGVPSPTWYNKDLTSPVDLSKATTYYLFLHCLATFSDTSSYYPRMYWDDSPSDLGGMIHEDYISGNDFTPAQITRKDEGNSIYGISWGPRLLIEGIVPGKLEDVNWEDLADVS